MVSTKRRKKRKKTASLIAAETRHAEFLKQMGIGKTRVKKVVERHLEARTSVTPTSDVVGAATKPVVSYKEEASQKYTVAPAYNKGPYQLISRANVKDIGK